MARPPRIAGLILGLSLSPPAPAQLQGIMGAILVTQISALTVSCLASESLSQPPPPPPPPPPPAPPPPPPPPPPAAENDTLLPADFVSGEFNRGDRAGGAATVLVSGGAGRGCWRPHP